MASPLRSNGNAQEEEASQSTQKQQQQQQQQQQGRESAEVLDDSLKGLDQTLALLAAKDDTSRFVGLALLKSTLETKTDFQDDPEIIQKCWEAIPSKFLDRLLKTGVKNEKPVEEARPMLELAVAVLHAFVILLPEHVKRSKKLVDRTPVLLDALPTCPSDSKTQILQILFTLASTEDASVKLLQSSAWLQLFNVADEQNLIVDIVKYTIVVASRTQLGRQAIQKVGEATISTLLGSFKDHALPAGFFEALADIVTASSHEVLSSNPAWLPLFADLLIENALKRHNAAFSENKHGLWVLTATMLRLYPQSFPSLLFSSKANISSESKPKSILLIKLMIVDIKSSIPSLQESLNSPDYPRTSARIACSYDIISAFIGFLIKTLDQESSSPTDSNIPLTISPSLLLQLRSEIAETMSLTIEHLRDRFDASVAGAMGLHPSARSHTEASPSAPLAISWDSSHSPMPQDHLTLSQIQTLALWLHEDDNDNLRKEAAGIMDVLLSLYTASGDEDTALQFRFPVLMGLESIIIVPEGVDAFLAADGWNILAKDLRNIVQALSDSNSNPNSNSIISSTDSQSHSQLGIDIIRVLLDIVQSEVTGPAKEDWMNIVELAAATSFPSSSSPSSSSPSSSSPSSSSPSSHLSKSNSNSPHTPPSSTSTSTLDFRISIAQLAVELLARAPRGVRRKNLASAKRLQGVMRDMRENENVEGEVRMGLEEVLVGLGELGIE